MRWRKCPFLHPSCMSPMATPKSNIHFSKCRHHTALWISAKYSGTSQSSLFGGSDQCRSHQNYVSCFRLQSWSILWWEPWDGTHLTLTDRLSKSRLTVNRLTLKWKCLCGTEKWSSSRGTSTLRNIQDRQKRITSLLLTNEKARFRIHDVKPSLIVFLKIILLCLTKKCFLL